MSDLTAPCILVVDDEPQIHRFLAPALQAAGYVPLRAETAADALRLIATHPPALVLLDLGLPDLDGKVVLERLRAFSGLPVIVVSARDREEEKVAALDAGADDYVEKPFTMAELLARIRSALRRAARSTGGGSPAVIHAGPLQIDLARRVAVVGGGEPLRLTPKEWDLLVAIASAGPGRVATGRQLLTRVWGPAHAEDTQYLRVYVGHLRAKLGEAASLIVTEPGVGYRFADRE
ncbi:response regulator [Roseomonas sp. CCTCC AB2023176]|uniref:response regulator n=1 Tax=Roseomonas sp. CCTCC AB2023176 TaxID=3342640 RepID=UPI0035D6D7DC